MSRATCAVIHVGAIRANFARVRQLAPASRVMAVVKADGYGHGLERVARALAEADAFGVASIADGERIRAAGLGNRVVVLSGHDEPGDLAEMRALGLDTVVHHDSQLALLEADRGRGRIRAWLKVDTGMHRLGFAPAAVPGALARLRALPAIDPEITLMTHFANADMPGDALTTRQIERFAACTAGLPQLRSLANSAGVLGYRDAHADWVRVGGLLYGLSTHAGRTGADHGFAPAMTLATRLIAVNRVAAGEAIGYGSTWTCPEDMPVGVAAIGYGDGYPRSAPAGTPVLVNGRRVPLIGRVSMDLVTLDLRSQPQAAVGDPVVLWGPELPVETVAAAAGTIGYELTCGLTGRVRFVEDAALQAAA